MRLLTIAPDHDATYGKNDAERQPGWPLTPAERREPVGLQFVRGRFAASVLDFPGPGFSHWFHSLVALIEATPHIPADQG